MQDFDEDDELGLGSRRSRRGRPDPTRKAARAERDFDEDDELGLGSRRSRRPRLDSKWNSETAEQDFDEDDELGLGLGRSRDAPEEQGGKTLRFALVALGCCIAFGLVLAFVMRVLGSNFVAAPPLPPRGAAAPPPLHANVMLPASNASRPPGNTLTYRADRSGHYFVNAEVNGAPIRFLVDTGATWVSLTPEDARAAGIAPGTLSFSVRAHTANGVVAVARTVLRTVRLEQLELTDVPAMVDGEGLQTSLLGMSFLSRVGFHAGDGVLTIEW